MNLSNVLWPFGPGKKRGTVGYRKRANDEINYEVGRAPLGSNQLTSVTLSDQSPGQSRNNWVNILTVGPNTQADSVRAVCQKVAINQFAQSIGSWCSFWTEKRGLALVGSATVGQTLSSAVSCSPFYHFRDLVSTQPRHIRGTSTRHRIYSTGVRQLTRAFLLRTASIFSCWIRKAHSA